MLWVLPLLAKKINDGIINNVVGPTVTSERDTQKWILICGDVKGKNWWLIIVCGKYELRSLTDSSKEWQDERKCIDTMHALDNKQKKNNINPRNCD